MLNLGGDSSLELTGATFIINGNGVLNIGNAIPDGTTAGTISGLSGSIVNGGAINFNQSDAAYTFSTTISGSGMVAQSAGGTTFLTGDNSYTGATAVDTGTLTLSGGGSIAGSSSLALSSGSFDISGTASGTTLQGLTGSGNVKLGGETLTIDNTANDNFDGVVSGTGGVTKSGSGTLTLTGANIYNGETDIKAGTLAVVGSLYSTGPVTLSGASATLDISGDSAGQTIGALSGVAGSNVSIGSNTLTFGDAGDTEFAGSFTGTGNLVKQGSGTVVLNGALSGFAGSTAITAGTLEVGDAADAAAGLGGDVTVANGATLRGHGAIGGNVVNDGTVRPGGSIGILTVDGDYTQNSGGTLNIEVTPSTVAGTGYDQLQVRGSASLSGALAVQVDRGTYIVGSQYDILRATGGVSGSFTTASYNPAYAAYITPVVTYSANDVTLELTPTSPSVNYSNSLAFSSGRIYVASNLAQDASLFAALASPLDNAAGPAAASGGTDRGYWLHGLGSFGHANGYDINEKGYVIGKGFDISPNLVFGLAVSNLYTSTSDAASSVDGTSFGALGYGIYTRDRLIVSASAGVGHLATNISRGLPTLGETAKASSNGAYEAASLRLQYRLGGPECFVIPYGSASYLHTGTGSAVETGASILDLRYDAISMNLAELGGGIMAGFDAPTRYGVLTPWVQLGGEGTLGNARVRNTETLGTLTTGETALAAPEGAFMPAAGVDLIGQRQWRIAAAWGGQFGSATSVESFSLEGRYVW